MSNDDENLTLPTPKITLIELINTLKNHNLIVGPQKKTLFSQDTLLNVFCHSKDCENLSPQSIAPPHYVYIARKGSSFDGHILAKNVLNSGNFFIGEKTSIVSLFVDDAETILNHNLFIEVHDAKKALHLILENAFKIDVKKFASIAVTGTNGKTSVTQILGHVLTQLEQKLPLKIGTLGVQIGNSTLPVSHVTTPDYPSFLNILAAAQKQNVQKIIMEATSHGLNENRLGDWKNDIAIFTNLTQDHLDYHKTMVDYSAAKQKLFQNQFSPNGTAIINIETEESKKFIQAAQGPLRNLII